MRQSENATPTAPAADELGADALARAFHETYERLAPSHGYETRRASAVPWEQVPQANRSLMVAVVRELISSGVIAPTTGGSGVVAAVCGVCNDTHRMSGGEDRGEWPCTHCPTPCRECAQGNGLGAYCATTPCGCGCHVSKCGYRRETGGRGWP